MICQRTVHSHGCPVLQRVGQWARDDVRTGYQERREIEEVVARTDLCCVHHSAIGTNVLGPVISVFRVWQK